MQQASTGNPAVKKVLLVWPETPMTYWSYKHALKFINKKSILPPLGIITVAAMLPEHYECTLVDLNIEELDDEQIQEADLVFISAMIVQKKSFDEVVARSKQFNKTVVAGGPYPTTSHEKISGVDHLILNEAEVTLPGFIEDLEKGTPKKIYADPAKPDITKTPPPRIDLLNIDAYSEIALQYSRGCPFNCEFCDIIEMFGRKPRTKSPEQFIGELEVVYDTGYRGSIFIVDDNFICNKNHVKELLRNVIKWQEEKKYPFDFQTEASIDLASDEELMTLMVNAGFSMVFVGIETPVEESLASSQKSQNLRENLLSSVEKIQRHGLEVTGGFIIGFDTDPENIFDLQIEFIQQSAIPTAMVGLLMALPKTQLYRRLQKEGRLVGDCSGNNTHELSMNFKPVLPEKTLVEGYKRVLKEIYSPGNFFKRAYEQIMRYPERRKCYQEVDGERIMALIKSLYKIGGSALGPHYFYYLFKIILRKPKFFASAVNFAVKGYHFHLITQELLKTHSFEAYLENLLKNFRQRIKTILAKNPEKAAASIKKQVNAMAGRIHRRYGMLNRESRNTMKESIISFKDKVKNTVTDFNLKDSHVYEIHSEAEGKFERYN